MFHKNFKSRYFFSKTHFMDSQINKVDSPTIFCVVLSDLMGFWDASISSSDHTRRHIQKEQNYNFVCAFWLVNLIWSNSMVRDFCPHHLAITKTWAKLENRAGFWGCRAVVSKTKIEARSTPKLENEAPGVENEALRSKTKHPTTRKRSTRFLFRLRLIGDK